MVAGAAVGVEGGAVARPADSDVGGARIDGVGAVGFEMCEHPIARSTLAGMDGADPAVADVAVGEIGHVERLAASVLARDDETRADPIASNSAVCPFKPSAW